MINALSSLTRYRFRRDRKLRSPSQIVNGLKVGYESLDLLHECNEGSPAALCRLSDLLDSTASQAERTSSLRAALAAHRSPPSPSKLAKIAHLHANATKANQTRYEGARPVLERPLPLSEIKGGKRRVPNLVDAQGLPMLRYSKPQPVSLSRMIRQRIQWEAGRWRKKHELEADMEIARWEDQWDGLVEEEMQEEARLRLPANGSSADSKAMSGAAQGEEPSWVTEAERANGGVWAQIQQFGEKKAAMAEKMWQIVLKERELGEKEKREAKIQRRLERKAAKARGECD